MGAEHQAMVALVTAPVAFFLVTVDAVIVNVALPSIRDDLGGGIAWPHRVVDGYLLMFAGLLLSSVGPSMRQARSRRRHGGVHRSLGRVCNRPDHETLIAARLLQGSAATMMMPSSTAPISRAHPDRAKRVGAVPRG